MIKFSAFADEVTDDFKGQVEFLAAQNIRNIEIRFVNQKNIMDLSVSELRETKNLLDSYSIGVSAIGSPIGKVKIDDDFKSHFERFKHAVELANYFDSPFIRVFSYYAPLGKSIADYRDDVIEKRMRNAEEEMKESGAYRHLIINDHLDVALEKMVNVICEEHKKRC